MSMLSPASGRSGRGLAPLLLVSLLLVVIGTPLCLLAQTDQPVYTDSLQNGWQNWSWATVNFGNSTPVHSGTASISVLCTNYQGLYLHHAAFDSSPYTNLTFWIDGGPTAGQPLAIQATLNGVGQPSVSLVPLTTGWQQIIVSLSALGVANQPNMDGFWIQSATQSQLPAFYVDDITLVAGTNPPVTNITVGIVVDAQLNRRPINPLIYGVAFANSSSQLSDLNCPLHRSGGNNETRYNWQINAHNLDADWYFESHPDSSSTPGATADTFVANSKNGGAQPMITIPMIGWAPKLGSGRSIIWSYSVAKYGPQTASDPYRSDAGNGISGTNGNPPITWNNPNDANFPTNTVFEQGYVQHLLQRWGSSTNGGVQYYLMDNEHSIWFSTHRDIHPVGPTMQEIWTNLLATATMVKSNDPNALVLAPEEWGWSGDFYSGYDQQWSGQHTDYNPAHYPDRAANGGWDYLPWLLNQFHQHDTDTGQRLLDYLTVHSYPQENLVAGSDVSPATVLVRNRSTRQFWDTNYVDPSWINSVIMLIPRMKSWVATYYPGTKIGVTEYNWGAESDANGATAQADLLGIFGREGLDLATRWTTPASGTPTYNAIKMYRNYDGGKSTFGDTSVNATSPNPDQVAVFAAARSSDGALTAMLINKQAGVSATATLTLTNFLANGTAQTWQLTGTNAIVRLADLAFSGNTVTNSLPPQSITLLVFPVGTLAPPSLRAGVISPTNTFDFWLDGTAGQTYVFLSSSNLLGWLPFQTNTLISNSLNVVVTATNTPRRFFRAQSVP